MVLYHRRRYNFWMFHFSQFFRAISREGKKKDCT
jgi:hypothetical protein